MLMLVVAKIMERFIRLLLIEKLFSCFFFFFLPFCCVFMNFLLLPNLANFLIKYFSKNFHLFVAYILYKIKKKMVAKYLQVFTLFQLYIFMVLPFN